MNAKQKLTRKEQAFVEYLANNPKASATEAALHAYNTSSRSVAAAIGYENLRKPHIQAYMQSINELLEETLLQAILDWGQSQNTREREIAVKTAMYVHTHLHGRAAVMVDPQISNIVHVEINLADDEPAPTDLTELAPIISR
jgi:hypothetical protein